jgi:hypothetical protein
LIEKLFSLKGNEQCPVVVPVEAIVFSWCFLLAHVLLGPHAIYIPLHLKENTDKQPESKTKIAAEPVVDSTNVLVVPQHMKETTHGYLILKACL